MSGAPRIHPVQRRYTDLVDNTRRARPRLSRALIALLCSSLFHCCYGDVLDLWHADLPALTPFHWTCAGCWRDCVGAGPEGPFPAPASAEGRQLSGAPSHASLARQALRYSSTSAKDTTSAYF